MAPIPLSRVWLYRSWVGAWVAMLMVYLSAPKSMRKRVIGTMMTWSSLSPNMEPFFAKVPITV